VEAQRAKASEAGGRLREELRDAQAKLRELEKQLKAASSMKGDGDKARKALATRRAAAQKSKMKVRRVWG
jgi:uncharacterized coiled-coil DUF342 family protein